LNKHVGYAPIIVPSVKNPPCIYDLQNPTKRHTYSFTHLGHSEELYHGVSEGIGIGTEVGNQTQHGSVEGAIDLLERGGARIVHVHHWDVTQKPEVEGYSINNKYSRDSTKERVNLCFELMTIHQTSQPHNSTLLLKYKLTICPNRP